jgi:hypothetical protein
MRIARAAQMPLRIAAKIPRRDNLLREQARAEHRWQADPACRRTTLGSSRSSPRHPPCCSIKWPEPFGLVMIEAMACGTPVIVYRASAVPEVVEDGVDSPALSWIMRSRRSGQFTHWAGSTEESSERFAERFAASRMAIEYERRYRELLARGEHERFQKDTA